jgi:hypothetical protein
VWSGGGMIFPRVADDPYGTIMSSKE